MRCFLQNIDFKYTVVRVTPFITDYNLFVTPLILEFPFNLCRLLDELYSRYLWYGSPLKILNARYTCSSTSTFII